MTPELDKFIRDGLDAQIASGEPFMRKWAPKHLYRIYTETRPGISMVVKEYFEGATIYQGVGLDARTQHHKEHSTIIEIVSSNPNADERVLELAKHLRHRDGQISVLVTRIPIETWEVTGQC